MNERLEEELEKFESEFEHDEIEKTWIYAFSSCFDE
jgi:hypothetical protein